MPSNNLGFRCQVELRNLAYNCNVIGAFKNRTHPCIFKGISITLYIEISQEGEGESDRTLRGEPCNVERIPSPISSQRSDGIWSV